jgi:hypothetical protein
MKAEEGKKNFFMRGHMNSLGRPPSSTVNECFGCTSRGCCISDCNMTREGKVKGGLAFH